jgi:hypothetical protein
MNINSSHVQVNMNSSDSVLESGTSGPYYSTAIYGDHVGGWLGGKVQFVFYVNWFNGSFSNYYLQKKASTNTGGTAKFEIDDPEHWPPNYTYILENNSSYSLEVRPANIGQSALVWVDAEQWFEDFNGSIYGVPSVSGDFTNGDVYISSVPYDLDGQALSN